LSVFIDPVVHSFNDGMQIFVIILTMKRDNVVSSYLINDEENKNNDFTNCLFTKLEMENL